MASDAQIAANRRNALKSTGPKTPEGKAAAALNRRQHGLRSRAVLLPSEDPREFHRLLAHLRAEYKPAAPSEESAVARLASAVWRLRRVTRIEMSVLQRLDRSDLSVALDRLHLLARYRATFERCFFRELHWLQARPDRLRMENLPPQSSVSPARILPLRVILLYNELLTEVKARWECRGSALYSNSPAPDSAMGNGSLIWLGVLLLLGLSGALILRPGSRLRRRFARRHERRQRALLEDVLKHICTRRHEGREADIEWLAGHLGLSAKKVRQLIMRIESTGLIRSEAGRLHLTERGEKWAVQVVRAHRLWETYLAHEARMPVAKLHKPAEREEHRLTASEQVDALDAFLGHPRSDPHGDPIPTASGEIAPLETQPLTAWPIGKPAEIAHVEDEPESVFREICDQGLRPGSIVQVSEQTPERLTFSDGKREYQMPPLVAGNIQVVPAPEVAPPREALLPLSDLKPGEEGEIALLDRELRGFTRRRLLDLGLTSKARVTALLANAFGDPLAFRVRATTIALRKDQASKIWVRRVSPSEESEARPA